MPWIKRKPRPHTCRTPKLSLIMANEGDLWQCPTCDTAWEVHDNPFTGRRFVRHRTHRPQPPIGPASISSARPLRGGSERASGSQQVQPTTETPPPAVPKKKRKKK